MPGMTLPPGFRFHPTDEELVDYYLKKRVKNIPIEFDVIADVDLYKCEPWDLPSKSKLPHGDNEWFFFSPRDRKYPNGSRTNRATEAGYWKATGRDRTIRQGPKTIGMKKTLVFYRGRAPHGERTDWLMHEYRLDGEEWENMNVPQDAYVLCRVFKKNGFGPPKNPSAGSGSMEEADQVDSPGEVKSSTTFADNDVKPSMTSLANLPPLSRPVSRPEVVSAEGHGPTAADNFEMRTASVFSDDPFVHNGSFRLHFNDQDADAFFLDEGLEKLRNDDESLEDFYKLCPPLEGSNLQLGDDDGYNEIPGLMDPSKVVRSEFHKQWQEQVTGAYQAFGGQAFTKQEDLVPPLELHENGFEPLPTLVQLPSPPSQSFEENDTESSCLSSSNNNFTTIRVRNRPSSVSASVGGNVYSSPYSAMRRVFCQQRDLNFTSSPPPVCESPPKLSAEKELLNGSQAEGMDLESNKSLDRQALTSETTNVDSEVAISQDSSRSRSAMRSPVPDVPSDERAVDNRSSLVPSPAVALVPRKRVVDAPISEGLSYILRVPSEASPSVPEMTTPKPTTDEVSGKEVLDKEVCFQETSGASFFSRGSAGDVGQLSDRNKFKPAEASRDKVPEPSNPTDDFLASDRGSMRIMGLRLLEPISGFSAGHTAPSKQKLTPREMASGIGSIHVNAVTVTCSCSSAGLPHVPTKACACYTTFWEGRCEKEKPTVEDSSEGQVAETGHNAAPCFSVRNVVFGILIPVLFAQFLLFPALSFYLSVERSTFRDSFLSFRDVLFGALGASLFYLVQRRPMPWRWIWRRS